MENDTVRLLRECNSGIKMGRSSINHVIHHAKNHGLKAALNACKDQHATLGDKTHRMLIEHGAQTKDPHPIASVMSDMKVRGKMLTSPTDKTIADVMTDGCDMGIKSLSRYLNQYTNASLPAKNIAKELISAEMALEENLRAYL